MQEKDKKTSLLKKLWQFLRKNIWQLLCALFFITSVATAIQLNIREHDLVDLIKQVNETNYTVAKTKDGKKITAVNILDKMPLNDTIKQSFKQAMIANIAIKEYSDSVSDEQLKTQMYNELITHNMTEKEYLKIMNQSKKSLYKDWTEQLALMNTLIDHTNISEKELNAVMNNYREKGTFLMAMFHSKEKAEQFQKSLMEKKNANYTLNETTVTNLIKQADGLQNNKYIKQSFSNYNDRFEVSVNDQIWATNVNEPSIVIQNEATDAVNQRFYVVFPLNKGEVVKKPNASQKRKMIEIAKRIKLMDEKEINKAIDDLLKKSDIQYRSPWSEVIE